MGGGSSARAGRDHAISSTGGPFETGTGFAFPVGMTADTIGPQKVYWHRHLPPLRAEAIGEHTIEASSRRVPGKIAYRDQLWGVCYDDLMREANHRLEQELERLDGHFAHVLDESISSRHDDVSGESWLQGRFTYMLMR